MEKQKEDENQPATIGDVNRIVRQSEQRVIEALTETMRAMQTELLRGFAVFSKAETIRLRKVEADQSNLDAALSGRVNVLEDRLMQIELRLGMHGTP